MEANEPFILVCVFGDATADGPGLIRAVVRGGFGCVMYFGLHLERLIRQHTL